ncbi:MAG: hypothetical protein J1F03_02090 [Oscillospiraceae bacterium]|nr:hypothetical protein [Oscillospiraceae bacterium]
MFIECIVIIGVFMLMEVVFLKTHHKVWALAMLPLGIVPLANIVLEVVVKRLFHADITVFGEVLILTIAVAVEAALLGFCSSLIESKRSKASYVSISNVFNIALALIFIHNILVRADAI